jgi:transposase
MEPNGLDKPTDLGHSGSNNHNSVDMVRWTVRMGNPWRDLPAHFGNWSMAFWRLSDWREANFLMMPS